MTHFTIRPVAAGDAPAIAAICNQGIVDQVATFETEPRSPAQIAEGFRPGALIVLAEATGSGVVAFAASFPYSPRPCYAGIGEFSVYVGREHRRQRAGGAVPGGLIEAGRVAGPHKLTSRVFRKILRAAPC